MGEFFQMSKSKNNNPNLYLIGFMGVGKSAVGRGLAQRLNMRFIDSDTAISHNENMSIQEIFKKYGEPHFRQLESEFVESGHPETGCVISCGGGLIMQNRNAEILKSKGIIICLFASADTIYQRTCSNKNRPLLNVKNPKELIEKLNSEREPIYLKVGIGVSTENRSIDEVAEHVKRIYLSKIK